MLIVLTACLVLSSLSGGGYFSSKSEVRLRRHEDTRSPEEGEHDSDDDIKVVFLHADNRALSGHLYLSLVTMVTHMYAASHAGHHYVFLDYEPATWQMTPPSVRASWPQGCDATLEGAVKGPKGCILNAVWAKVKALLIAYDRFPSAEYIVFLDSDATINPHFADGNPIVS